MRYVSSRINVKISDDIYRFYITNALKILTSNTARFAGGTELTKTYSDIISDDDQEELEKENEEKAADIISNIKAKISKVKG